MGRLSGEVSSASRHAAAGAGASLRFALRAALAMLSLLLAASPALAQTTDLNGGPVSVAWNVDCSTTKSFKNNTGLPLAGLWIGINFDGITNPPEIRDISVGGATWDVDDNEDADNGDGSENDQVDSTPLSLSSGWHRVQARTNADILSSGTTFTLKLCADGGASLSGQTIFLVPMASQPGQTGGDQSRRIEPKFGVSQGSPNGSVTINGVNAPPNSRFFSVRVDNQDGAKHLKKLKGNPPGGVTIQSASASSGGTFDGTDTIVWISPIPPGSYTQVNVEASAVTRSLSTTIGFTATEFVTVFVAPVPAMPGWSVVLLAALVLLAGYVLLRKS